jgi:hypothetical protein
LPIFDLAFTLPGQIAENLAQKLPETLVNHLPAALWDKQHMILAIPFRMA